LDDQVLAFIKIITPHLTGVYLEFQTMQMENLDKQQRGFMNQLLKIFQEEKATILITMHTRLDNIQFLPDMDNKTQKVDLNVNADTDIPLLINWLATPRLDGQQRVIWLSFWLDELAMKMVDAIKQVDMIPFFIENINRLKLFRNSALVTNHCHNLFSLNAITTSLKLHAFWIFQEVRKKMRKRMKH
jgi:hypothetical protein